MERFSIKQVSHGDVLQDINLEVNLISAIKKGIGYLLTQNFIGYPEAVHYMTLPCLTSQGVMHQMHPTVFFQRMVILDSLLDCFETDDRITKELIKDEIAIIIKSRHPHLKGGWSYIPDFLDLPPDTDDLGMVIQLLSRTGGSGLASISDEALEIIFKYNTCPDGSFDLWIIDPSDTSQHTKEIYKYIKVIGGRGPSPEVMGNLIYALALYDIEKFKHQIEKGVRYLESCQDEKGFWPSKWYWGNYYGTYRAVDALRTIDPSSISIFKAGNYLIDVQNRDGGWGEETSNPIDTALALLSLSKNSDSHNTQQKGISYLIQKQLADGSWNSSPFIKLLTSDGPVTYESSTITTSLCIKALAKAISYNSNLIN
jgi:squalene-hopene/tetraprenyl-beta-curcumene cyclase